MTQRRPVVRRAAGPSLKVVGSDRRLADCGVASDHFKVQVAGPYALPRLLVVLVVEAGEPGR